MNSTDYYINNQLVQYVSSCFKNERQSIIESLIIQLFDLLLLLFFRSS